MEDLKAMYQQIPPFSRYYLTIVFGIACSLRFVPSSGRIIIYLLYNMERVLKGFQIWRLVTCFCFAGSFSPNFLSFLFTCYLTYPKIEKLYKEQGRYPEFVMIITYVIMFLNIFYLITYLIGLDLPLPNPAQQLVIAVLYIFSKREPDRKVMFYFFIIKNCYVPFALLLMDLISGGSVWNGIVGIIIGHLYYFLKDVAPLIYGREFLVTPKFVVDWVERLSKGRPADRARFSTVNNNSSSGNYVNRSGSQPGGNNNQHRGYVPFSGTGHSLQ